MSLSWILIVGVIGWNIYRAYKKAQMEQVLNDWQTSKSEEDQQFAEVAPRRFGGISEGQTVEWAEAESRIVVPSVHETVIPVHETLTTLQETQHDLPRPSSRTRAEEAPPETTHTSKLQLLTKHNLRQAVVLSEVLGEPRAKRPWRPNRRR